MKISYEKATHLSHVLVKSLEAHPEVRLLEDLNPVRLKLLEMLRAQLKWEEQLAQRVREKITAQKRPIPEGSQEWDILFRKYYEEEIGKTRA